MSAISPHAVSGVLKLFFRNHPNPLMTFERYDAFLDAHRKGISLEITRLVSELPSPNGKLVIYLCRFLARIAIHANVNKMTPNNLGIVFAPNILRPAHETYESVARV